jgi:hypothetical protein
MLAVKATEYLFWVFFDFPQELVSMLNHSIAQMLTNMLNKIEQQLLPMMLVLMALLLIQLMYFGPM